MPDLHTFPDCLPAFFSQQAPYEGDGRSALTDFIKSFDKTLLSGQGESLHVKDVIHAIRSSCLFDLDFVAFFHFPKSPFQQTCCQRESALTSTNSHYILARGCAPSK